MRMNASVQRWIASGVVCVVTLLAAACGGGNNETLAPTPTGASPATGAVPAPTVLPTVDPNVSLVNYESAEMGYSISYPEGWEYSAGLAGTDFFTWGTPERRVLAQLSVTRVEGEGLTADSLIQRDAAAVGNFGVIDPGTAVPVQVSGMEGKHLRYSVRVVELRIEHIVAYAADEESGWRIGLNTFGAGTLDPYVLLFERIIESFRRL